jgi:hypothetical protein
LVHGSGMVVSSEGLNSGPVVSGEKMGSGLGRVLRRRTEQPPPWSTLDIFVLMRIFIFFIWAGLLILPHQPYMWAFHVRMTVNSC